MATYRIERDNSVTYEFSKLEFERLVLLDIAETDLHIEEGEQIICYTLDLNLYLLQIITSLSMPLFEDPNQYDPNFHLSLH